MHMETTSRKNDPLSRCRSVEVLSMACLFLEKHAAWVMTWRLQKQIWFLRWSFDNCSPKPNRTRWNLQTLSPSKFQINRVQLDAVKLQSRWKSNGQYFFHDKIKIVSEFLSVDSLWFKPYTKQVLKQHRREDICQKRLCFSKVNMTKSFSIDLFSTLAECPSGRLPVYRSWDLDLTAERSDKITQSTSLE